MTNQTSTILDGVNNPLSDEQMADVRRSATRLRISADFNHYDTNKRRRARCACGNTWPCELQSALLNAADLMEALVSELTIRRQYARPLTGLDKVRNAVRAARGGDALPQIRGYA